MGPEIKVISQVADFSFEKLWYELADENHFWMQWRVAALKNQMRRLNIPWDKEMGGAEIGCGRGVFTRQLRQITEWTIDGIELDAEALQFNKHQRGQLYLYNILEKNTEFAGRYDFLFIYDVLEHIADTRSFLEACSFHLKPGGYLFVNVPAIDALKSAYDNALGHLRRYNRKTLSCELSRPDLKILDISYWGFFLLPLLGARKIMTSSKQNHRDIVEKGFRPPGKIINSFLKFLMRIETAVFQKVPLGISIMAVAQKV